MCISLYKFLILIFFLDSEKCVGEVYDELEISDPGYESLDDRTVIHLVPGNNNNNKKKKKTSPAGFFVFLFFATVADGSQQQTRNQVSTYFL